MAPQSLPQPVTLKDWTSRVVEKLDKLEASKKKLKTAAKDTIASIVGLGTELNRMKSSVSHGEWGRFFDQPAFEDYDIDQSKAIRLMKIAKHPTLIDKSKWHQLPPSYQALYQLSRLDQDEVQELLEKKLIRSDTSKNEITTLVQNLKTLSGEVKEVKALPSPTPTSKKETERAAPRDEEYEAPPKRLNGKPHPPSLVGILGEYFDMDIPEDLDDEDQEAFEASCRNAFQKFIRSSHA